MAPFRILALDGGGVRAVLQPALLARLCAADSLFAAQLAACATSKEQEPAQGLEEQGLQEQALEQQLQQRHLAEQDSEPEEQVIARPRAGSESSSAEIATESTKHSGSSALASQRARAHSAGERKPGGWLSKRPTLDASSPFSGVSTGPSVPAVSSSESTSSTGASSITSDGDEGDDRRCRLGLLAGTSAGSIVAGGLALGLLPEELIDIFRELAPLVFAESALEEVERVAGLAVARYGNAGLRALLERTLSSRGPPDCTLADLKQPIAIPTFNACAMPLSSTETPRTANPLQVLNRWRPEILTNWPGSESAGIPLLDAMLRSGAAPTYFPVFQGCVDGGIFANNPSLVAVSLALEHGIPLEDISVLSIGTGLTPRRLAEADANADYGLVSWAPQIVPMLMDACAESADIACRMILGERYLRVDPILTEDISLDDEGAVEAMIKVADSVDCEPILAWLGTYWGFAAEREAEPLPEDSKHRQADARRRYGDCVVM